MNKKNDLIQTEKALRISLSSYELSDDAVENEYSRKIPKHIKKKMLDMHDLLVSDPGKAINKILRILDQYPDIPLLQNNLASAYFMTGQKDKAEEVARNNYEKFPKYLFAMTNYAQICLDQKKFALIPEIFDHKYDLKAIYPKRKIFHYTEFIAFAGVMSRYFFQIGEDQIARIFCEGMEEVDRWHPMTVQTKKIVYPSLLRQIVRKLLGPERLS